MAVFVFKYNTLSLWMFVYYDDIIGLGKERTIGNGVWIGEIRSIRSWIAFHNGVQLVYICKNESEGDSCYVCISCFVLLPAYLEY